MKDIEKGVKTSDKKHADDVSSSQKVQAKNGNEPQVEAKSDNQTKKEDPIIEN